MSYSIKHLCTKEGCLFVLYVTLRSPKHLATLGVVVKPSMSKGWIKLVSYCFQVQQRSYELLNKFFTDNSFKLKRKLQANLGVLLILLGNHSLSKI